MRICPRKIKEKLSQQNRRKKKQNKKMRKIIFRFLFQCLCQAQVVQTATVVLTVAASAATAIQQIEYTQEVERDAFAFFFICVPHTYFTYNIFFCLRFSSSFRTIIPSQFAASHFFSFDIHLPLCVVVRAFSFTFHIFLSFDNAFL